MDYLLLLITQQISLIKRNGAFSLIPLPPKDRAISYPFRVNGCAMLVTCIIIIGGVM